MNKKILLIVKEAVSAMSLSGTLKRMGYDVEMEINPKTEISVYEIDLIIVAGSLYESIKDKYAIPKIVFTGSSAKFKECVVLEKPCTITDLKVALDQIFKEKGR